MKDERLTKEGTITVYTIIAIGIVALAVPTLVMYKLIMCLK